MEYTILVFDKIIELPWKEIFSGIGSTFVGAWLAFFWNKKQETNKQTSTQKELLITYFCNLNATLRNFCIFGKNLQISIKAASDPSVKFLPAPVSNIIFDFDEKNLSYVQNVSKLFYENIIQLRIEMQSYAEMGNLYKETKQSIYLQNMNNSFIIHCAQLIVTIENTNNYLKKYYDTDLINEEVENNIKEINNGCVEWLNENKTTADINVLKKVYEIETDYNNIKNGWKIDFDKDNNPSKKGKK